MADPTRPVTGYPAPPASNGYPPGTAYAYAAHPAQNPPPTYFNVSSNPYYSNHPAANQQRVTFLRRMFAVIIGFIIITGTIMFIMWLVLRPQLPQFRVETLTLDKFNISNSMVSGNWDAWFTVRNPNSKINLFYTRVEAAVYYKLDSIAETSVPPFDQGKKNETGVRATFASVSAYVDDWDGISKEKGRGSVEFNLRMVARVKFKAGAWWARRRIVRVYCPGLSVGVSANSMNGSLTGGPKQCSVGL
ncbi:NDR1/HIN1-like protein 1 [Bidens hawaiensis]|uniref:NDR1/HIN1-like protein 1 n=1 Tax=Bidens hawaiensis TaxID=980011 RepID=UPI00404A8D5A